MNADHLENRHRSRIDLKSIPSMVCSKPVGSPFSFNLLLATLSPRQFVASAMRSTIRAIPALLLVVSNSKPAAAAPAKALDIDLSKEIIFTIAQNKADLATTKSKKKSDTTKVSNKKVTKKKSKIRKRNKKAKGAQPKLSEDTRTQAIEEKSKDLKQLQENDLEKRGPIETAIARLVIPKFTLRTKVKKVRKEYKDIEDEFQSDLVDALNRVSYLDALPLNATVKAGAKSVKRAANQEASDGVLTGTVQSNALKLSMRSGHSGRNLLNLTVPFNLPLEEKANFESLVEDTVHAIVNNIPYRGYITEINNDTVTLNIGKHQALKQGDTLRVFEFSEEQPTLTSAKTYLGEVEITQLAKEASRGKIIRGATEIHAYAKLDFEESGGSSAHIDSTYFPGFWVGAGAGSYFLDTQGVGTHAPLAKRLYQVTLTPAINFAMGYNRIFFEANYAKASNPLQSVSFFAGDAHFQWIMFRWQGFALSSSIGGSYSSTSVELVDPSGTLTLVPHAEISPSIELRLQYAFTPRARIFTLGRILYPITSSDELGENIAFPSFGFSFLGGFRVDLMKSWAIENTYSSVFRYLVYPEDSVLADLSFMISLRVLKEF